MGWFGCHKPAGQSYLEFFKGEIETESDTKLRRVLDGAVKNFCFYGIIADIDKTTGTTEHWVAVYPFRLSKDYYNVTYKPMDEGVHPYYYDVPEKIWKKIEQMVAVPERCNYSGEWRERVRHSKAKPKLRKGSKFQLAEPLKFTNGAVLSRFEYLERGSLAPLDEQGNRIGYLTYKITRLNDREYSLI